jgi:hypothetical protein
MSADCGMPGYGSGLRRDERSAELGGNCGLRNAE